MTTIARPANAIDATPPAASREPRPARAGTLSGRIALVTGAGSGLGAATAEVLAAAGATVALADVDAGAADRISRQLHDEGADSVAFELDVRSAASAQAAIESITSQFGALDILVNNAGTDQFGFFHQTTPEQWDIVLDVNLKGVFHCTAAALPGMQEAGYGRVVNLASEAGRVGSKGSAVYSAAKGGVISFTKVMAREGARFGINFNAIAPGPIETPLLMAALEFGEIGEKIIENMKAGTQLRRMGTPDEVAAAIAFFASDDASYVTGEILGVSGGMGMTG
jgi:2-hydroxycyclohexanecarboxyl-CoA dehydrogenase